MVAIAIHTPGGSRSTFERGHMQEISLWGMATVVGPIVLLVLFIFVILRNRSSSRASKDLTERATKANYEAEDRAHKDDAV